MGVILILKSSCAVAAGVLLAATAPACIAAPTATNTLFSDDWGPLSPRSACMGNAGMEDIGQQMYSRADERHIADLQNFNFEKSMQAQNDWVYRDPNTIGERFLQSMQESTHAIGSIIAPTHPDFPRLVRISKTFQEYKVPSEAEIQGKPGTSQQWMNKLALVEAKAIRYCALDYLALAYGKVAPDVGGHYAEVVAEWERIYGKGTGGAKPDRTPYYPNSFASLNFIASLLKLNRNDSAGAFALSTDRVMQEAVNGDHRVPFAAHWVASFHIAGLGTPVSLPKALAVYESVGGPLEEIQASLIVARLGRRPEAVSRLGKVIEEYSYSKMVGGRAKRAYALVSGSQWVDKPKPGFWDAVLAIPVLIVAWCNENKELCAAMQSSRGGSSMTSYSPDTNPGMSYADTMNAIHDAEEMNAPEYKGSFGWAGECEGFRGQYGC